MAAVAGSKGRIADSSSRPSFQAQLANRVIKRELSPAGAAAEILQRSQIREVGIDTNMMCNLRCVYCYLEDRPVEPGKLTASDWLDLLIPLERSGCKLFAFIGKEPLLDDVAVTVLKGLDTLRNTGRSFRTGMVTNGTRLPRYLDRIADANLDYLDVSLDGLPEINDAWRGAGTSERVLRHLQLLIERQPRHDLFVSCVLHQGNINHLEEFVATLFAMGVPGFFTSPVLKFTGDDTVAEWAISHSEVNHVVDRLVALAEHLDIADRQIVMDLPYRYAWWLLESGRVPAEQVFEDAFEVPYYQPDETYPVFLKMNLLSYSFWRAIRITHDGVVIDNLDLAAHPAYHTALMQSQRRHVACGFHTTFLETHSSISTLANDLYDRAVGAQLAFHTGMSSI